MIANSEVSLSALRFLRPVVVKIAFVGLCH